jgi:SAM-dependent methyltransferase
MDESGIDTIERIHAGTAYWNAFFFEHKERYEFAAPYCRGKTVLDAACGTGFGADILSRHGAKKVVGVDANEDAISEARRLYRHGNLEFALHDVCNLNALDQRFDLVVSFETIEHLGDPARFLSQVRSVLSADGLFICSSPNRNYRGRNHSGNPFHISEMSYEEFQRLFDVSFTAVGRFHQSPTPDFARISELAHAVELTGKLLQRSLALRLENAVRRLLGKDQLSAGTLSKELTHARPHDYPVLPLNDPPGLEHLAFVFLGRPRVEKSSGQ